jgi:Tfp pilus assembly protein PilO
MKKSAINITGFTTKRALIDKANTVTVIAAGGAAFLVVFSLVSAKTFVSQIGYQNKVIAEKKLTLEALDKNLEARDSIVKSYNAFTSSSQNLIGGSSTSSATDKDGDNAKIILDALPSKYDFPAVISSLEKIAIAQNLQIQKIEGLDDEAAQASQQKSPAPKPTPMIFKVEVKGSYVQLKSYLDQLDRSIRPVQVQKYVIEATDDGISETIDAQTFYQPEKVLELRKEVLKP